MKEYDIKINNGQAKFMRPNDTEYSQTKITVGKYNMFSSADIFG